MKKNKDLITREKASLVKHMMQSDVKLVQKEHYLKAVDYHLSTNLE